MLFACCLYRVCVCVCVVHPESAMQNVADNKTSQSAMYQNTQVALVMSVGPYFFPIL